ncbi:MAG: FAD-dependent oxidoreductase [Methanomassiliicoccales archaeon]|nr:FAD-dependent oxidoreductase [Methanomassiliicoccales archaeon]
MTKLDVLVIGAGIGGLQASQLLSKAGHQVHLVERTAHIGGTSVKFENVFPNLECATCMLSPLEQELLQDPNVHILTLTEVAGLEGGPGDLTVKLRQRARYVSMDNCIGCAACFDVCPVSASNEFEESLSQRKAIYLPCAGALPNVPRIDPEVCLRFKGQECSTCQEACAFEAIEYEQKDQEIELKVGAVLVAVGCGTMDLKKLPQFSYDSLPEVFSALEFERLYASNGPTAGQVQLRDGRVPSRIALVHCVGRKEEMICSGVCCRYLLKFRHYLRVKLPDTEVLEFHSDLCLPNKGDQRFMAEMAPDGQGMIRAEVTRVKGAGGSLKVFHRSSAGEGCEQVDMVVLAPALVPPEGTEGLSKVLGLELASDGFLAGDGVLSSRPGVFILGGARGPKDIRETVAEALAAAGEAMRCAEREGPE